ncbi:MAG TPA: hydrolase TatD [Firmicutes bacterium]|jgi:TatD DNase family protein|nr:hydrolase TatD [Bacillota bacterium]HAW70043.1 hydrolase TatD [Bacillota bacterium]HAZ22866.1 hydrolase TatD [Bacillota bacterium]HBE06976.1 hydrolase TatD [Bacillota bacterium]HBG43845.1 hydrolase TatD [Bacillota bacterium]
MFLDSHVHLDDVRFAEDREQVIQRALDADVTTMINVGADMKSTRESLRLAKGYPGIIYAAVGIHPHDAKSATENDYSELEGYLAQPEVLAVGEIGLDYHYDLSPREVQRTVFEQQLKLAVATDKPVIIHMREATQDTLNLLQQFTGRLRGVMHCFSGSWETACAVLDLGLHLGFDGPLTFANAAKLREVAGKVPSDRILIETDCPYLTPVPYRGKRNEPAYVREVAAVLAELKKVDLEEIASLTANNARDLFSII